MGLMYPGFPGTGFVGKLDALGKAEASIKWKPDINQEGITLYFAYIVLSSGGTVPVLEASNPVNMTVTKY